MAKDKRPTKAEKRTKVKGQAQPVCVAMLACDQVVIGNDRTATIVRVVDTIGLPRDKVPKKGELYFFGDVTLFISLKKGEVESPVGFVVTCVDPDKKRTPVGKGTFRPVGEPEAGMNIIGKLHLRWGGEGLYWFELSTDTGLVARTPVKFVIGEPVVVDPKLLKEAKAV